MNFYHMSNNIDVINDTKSPKSVKLFKEFFNKNTELGKEYELYSILLNKKYKNLTHTIVLIRGSSQKS